MTKLYIANATQQIRQFTYWVPEGSRSMIREIPIGGQTMIGDYPSPAVESILSQHQKYGLVSVPEALKSAVFDGLAYQLDKPVSYERIVDLVDKYKSILNQRGRKLRTEAALANNEFIEQQLFNDQSPARLRSYEMSVEEIKRDQRDETPEISEGVRVERAPTQTVERPRIASRAKRGR